MLPHSRRPSRFQGSEDDDEQEHEDEPFWPDGFHRARKPAVASLVGVA
jgi:hypothetical protein